MNNGRLIIIAALLGGLSLAAIIVAISQSRAHQFDEGQCRDCHAAEPVKGLPEARRMTAPVSRLCARCHEIMEESLSHPVEIVPQKAVVPPDMPLTVEGRMTCSTCHDIHADDPSAGARHYLRRDVSGPELCRSCHGAFTGHTEALDVIHMKYTPGTMGLKIDDISRNCLSCHDGTISTSTDVAAGSWSHGTPLTRFDPGGSHPIGVVYRQAMMEHGGLRPPEQLDPAVKLIDGKVGCISCHDLFSKRPQKLVMSNAGSRLCFACHDK